MEIFIIITGYGKPKFAEMEKELGIHFEKGLPTEPIEGSPHKTDIVIFDDLNDEVCEQKEAERLFTSGAHHKNLIVILVTQNLCHQGKCARNTALNIHYLKNFRDGFQVQTLGRQMGIKGLKKSL